MLFRSVGQAIASSPIFAEHGINIAAVFDRDPEIVGNRAGHLGKAIAGSSIFGEHGITIAAVFDTDVRKLGTPVSGVEVTDYRRLKDVIREKNIVVGVLAVPAPAAQHAADDLVDAGVRIIFNYSEALLDVPSDVQVHASNPAVELLYALYFHLT